MSWKYQLHCKNTWICEQVESPLFQHAQMILWHGAGPAKLLKVLAAGPSSSNALFQFSLPKATAGVAAAAAGGLDGLNLITRKDRFGKSASQANSSQVHSMHSCSWSTASSCRPAVARITLTESV